VLARLRPSIEHYIPEGQGWHACGHARDWNRINRCVSENVTGTSGHYEHDHAKEHERDQDRASGSPHRGSGRRSSISRQRMGLRRR
jgi:hypothetical protein